MIYKYFYIVKNRGRGFILVLAQLFLELNFTYLEMALCGFTKEMLDGLEVFYKGLAEAMKKKKGFPDSMSKEIYECHSLIGEIDLLKNEFDKQALKAITMLVQAFFRKAIDVSEKENISLEESFKRQADHLRELFDKTDEIFYAECEQKMNPHRHLMKRLNEEFE